MDFSAGCVVMGVLNVTPDSFSDGGQFFERDKAIAHGLKMAADGAAIIDVGAESTRPGAKAVPADEQIKRAIPVIEALAKKVSVPISIDTYNFEVAEAALDAGASMINDIMALSDERMAKLAAEREVPVVLMHTQGTPATMQIEPKYKDVVDEVLKFLIERAKRAEKFGIERERIFIDPGIGFGKMLEHNLELLRKIDRFVKSGYRVLVGTSRKAFLGKLTGKENPQDRIFGTAATVALCAAAGVSIVRVHDVAEMAEVVKVANSTKKEISMKLDKKLSMLKFLSQTHRNEFNERRKYEWKILFAVLTFYVLAVAAVCKEEFKVVSVLSEHPGWKTIFGVVGTFVFLLLAFVTSCFLFGLHKANDSNKQIAHTVEGIVGSLLQVDMQVPSPLVDKVFVYQTITLFIFAVTASALVILKIIAA